MIDYQFAMEISNHWDFRGSLIKNMVWLKSKRDMSRDMTKPTIECAPSEDSDQSGHPPSAESLGPWLPTGYPTSLIRVFAVRSVGGCPGWSEPSLGKHSFCWFCHVAVHVYFQYVDWEITRNFILAGIAIFVVTLLLIVDVITSFFVLICVVLTTVRTAFQCSSLLDSLNENLILFSFTDFS